MGVFPAASRSHVPSPWAELMVDAVCFLKLTFELRIFITSLYTQESAIIYFYPEDFKIDLNGKKYAWQGVALLPFVDEERLKRALKPLEEKLTEEESKRATGFQIALLQTFLRREAEQNGRISDFCR